MNNEVLAELDNVSRGCPPNDALALFCAVSCSDNWRANAKEEESVFTNRAALPERAILLGGEFEKDAENASRYEAPAPC